MCKYQKKDRGFSTKTPHLLDQRGIKISRLVDTLPLCHANHIHEEDFLQSLSKLDLITSSCYPLAADVKSRETIHGMGRLQVG